VREVEFAGCVREGVEELVGSGMSREQATGALLARIVELPEAEARSAEGVDEQEVGGAPPQTPR
jgi:hypothetical protein